MIYGFTRQSGGHARIYSELGQGTMVCLYLPRHEGEELVKPKTSAPEPLAASNGKTVLVVDDEPSVRMLITDVLEDQGYVTIEVGTGAAALEVLASDAAVDLLVTDIGLPGGMNGRQLADAARTQRADLKILFITGYAENAMMRAGDLVPHLHVLNKPFTMDELALRISALMA
jgi:CheY-like chemotaxis protein